MARKYVDRNYKHKIPKTRLQALYNFVSNTKEGKAIAYIVITMTGLAISPTYYYYKEVGRKEFMRREDRKVAGAVASVNIDSGDSVPVSAHQPEAE